MSQTPDRLDELLDELAAHYGSVPQARANFARAEARGLHIAPCHFYSPIPDTRTLAPTTWTARSSLAGIDMNEAGQLDLLHSLFARHTKTFATFPLKKGDNDLEFSFDNDQISGADPFALYAFVRERRPQRIVEVGSGYSTLVTARAVRENGQGEILCVEPYPRDFLPRAVEGIGTIVRQPVQSVDMAVFEALGPGDILFIDSTHVSRIGSDVNFLVLEVLPRLAPGVLVHIHDIFMPADYPETWIRNYNFFWNEQYLIQAFLCGNRDYVVRFCVSYMGLNHLDAMQTIFPGFQRGLGGGSLWIEKTRSL